MTRRLQSGYIGFTAPGPSGLNVLSGSGAPSGGTGVDGEFYIRTSDWTIYGPKAAGAWGSPTALIGANGTNGTNGIGVPAGGTALQVLRKINGTDYNTEWANPAGGGDALVANPLSQFATTTSAQLAGVMSDETGSASGGLLMFNNGPTMIAPILNTPASGTLTNCIGLPYAGLTAAAIDELSSSALAMNTIPPSF